MLKLFVFRAGGRTTVPVFAVSSDNDDEDIALLAVEASGEEALR
jgi:hypothetical protein